MSSIQFTRISKQNAIFKATPIDGAPANADQPQVIFLAPGKGHGQTLSLEQSWAIGSGRYIFLDQPLSDPDTFAENFKKSNPPAGVRFVWLRNPNENTTQFIGPRVSIGSGVTKDPTIFSFQYNTNISLTIGPRCAVTLDSDNDRFIFQQPAGNQAVYLTGNQGTRTPLSVVGQNIFLPLAGAPSGCLQFQVSLSEADMSETNLDIGCRYFVDNPNTKGALISQQYPVFSLPGGATASLMMSIDIFDAFNTSRTYLSFTAEAGSGQPVVPSAIDSYFRTNTGQTISLTPQNDALLIFAVNAQSVPPGQSDPVYLVPQNHFVIEAESSEQTPGDTGVPAVRFMCGFAGTEYFGLDEAANNVLLFTPGQPAYAPSFWTASTAAALLDSDATTSWVSLEPATASELSYFAQPNKAELFGAGFPSGGQSAGAATGANGLSFCGFQEMNVPLSASAAAAAYPLAPYAGLTPIVIQSPAAILALALETQIISPYRRQLIGTGSANGNSNSGTSGADTTTNNATTPQGLLANVTSSAWNTLTLGQDDNGGVLTLSNISSDLQSALQTNQQFLVISEATAINFINSKISIGGWIFDLLGVGASSETYSNVLIFKFYNDTIKNLAANTAVWAGQGTAFNANVAAVSTFLQQYISDAEAQLSEGNVRFQSFVDLVNDPAWNGVIALNVTIPVNELPQEVQGLIGGMDLTKFSAHHFGIETNTIGPDFSLLKSSLFAMINYDNTDSAPGAAADPDSLYDFKVLTLQVVFANSEITDFNSQIAITINELFSEPASLDDSSTAAAGEGSGNTIILNGSYEDHDGVSTYSFVAAGSYVFNIDSVIFKSIEFTKVQFTTVTSNDNSGEITSSFSFWGTITFGSFTNFDFFSFDDLYFADLSLSFTFNPNKIANGIPIQNFTFDPGNLRFDVSISQARQDSLLGQFPLRLLGFTYANAGVTISDLGYTPLNVPLISDLDNSKPMTFSLTFSLDLGSIGGLATPLKGFAANLVAGWTPGSGTTQTTVGIGFKLPESSGGKLQIGIEGVLLLTINNFLLTDITKEADLAAGAMTVGSPPSQPYYVIYLNGCMLDVLGTQVPPGGTFEFLFFVPQGQGTSSALSNLGWYVAYKASDSAAQLTAGESVAADDGSSSLLSLSYLGLGQRVQLPEGVADAQTVSDVLEAMADQLAPTDPDPDKLKAQLAEIYNKNQNWIVGGKFTILETITLGAVYYDPSTYGMLLGIAEGKLGPLGGFYFEILYKKVTDTIGVYQIQLTLPDAIRQLQFGEVSITIPVIGIDVYTNGNFKIDVGFPVGLDFSNSLSVQVFPFVGYGGFYYAQLSGATSTNVPVLPDGAGTFNPVLEFGFALSLGVGKTIDQGIFQAGVTVTFVGILEGVVAYWVPPNQSSSTEVMFNQAPDYYVITGQIAIVGNLYGVVDFGIVKASLSVTISAGAGLTWKAYDSIVLSVNASVKVAVTVVIGGFKIFGHRIEIKISFSFSTTISYSWTIPDNRTPPWAQYLTTPEALFLGDSTGATEYQPITWDSVQIYANPQSVQIYFSPQVTVTIPQGTTAPQAQFVALLTINTAPLTGSGFSDFDYLASALLGWTINQYVNPTPSTYDPDLQVAAADLNSLSTQLSDSSTPPLDYGSLGSFLGQNFVASLTDVPTQTSSNTGQETTVFPMIPNLTLTATGQQPVNFDSQNMVPASYLEDISEYFAQLLVNFDTGQSQNSLAATDAAVSMATIIFEDYFLLIIKAAIGKAADYLSSEGAQTLGTLLTALQASPNQYSDVAGQAGRFLLHGLQLPQEFPDTDPSEWNDLTTYPLYGLVGQQVPLVPDNTNNYSATLAINPSATPQSWVAFATASTVGGAPTTTVFDGGQELSDVDGSYVGSAITFTSGALKGNSSTISAYTGATRQITVGPAFSAAPAAGDQFVIAVQPTAAMDPTEIGTIAELVSTYSTYQPTISVRQLPNLVQQPASYTLQRPTPLTFVNDSNTAWTIWPFPTTLMDQLANDQASPLEVVLKQGAIGQTQSGPSAVDYNWATIVNLSAQQIPIEGGFLTNTYLIGGADETGRNLLDDLIGLGATGINNVVDNVYLLFNPQSSGSTTSGLNSDSSINTSATAILKINLSTESAPPSEALLAMALAAEPQIPADQYSAAMNQYYYFFKLIWECSIVNAGGYYLYYVNAANTGLPSYLFTSGTTTNVSLLITFKSGQQVASYNNAVVTTSDEESSLPSAADDSEQDTVFYAEATNLMTWHAALEAGSVGFTLTCVDPMTTYTMPESLAATAVKREGLTRDDVIAALAKEGIDAGHPKYRTMMDEAGDQDNSLMNLFNLLTYNTVDNTVFETSMQGLPVGPINTTGAVSDPAPQTGSFYANIGISATNDFYDGSTLTFTSGALDGQTATISKYTATTQQIVLSQPLSPAPANGDTFEITSANWYFQQAVSAYRWYNTGSQTQNTDPYAGVGKQVVLAFQLRDLFGNPLVPPTPISSLPADSFYFDDLIPVTAWPGVQASYLCASQGGSSNLDVTLSFEPSTFMPAIDSSVDDTAPTSTSFIAAQGLASADNYYVGSLLTFTAGALSGETRTISQYTAATRQLVVSEAFSAAPANGDKFTITYLDNNRIQQGVEAYETIGYQLGGTGVSISMSTSLDPTTQPPIPLAPLQALVTSIITFLNGILANPQSPQPPAPFVFSYPIPPANREANANNIFEVTVTININREPTLVDPNVRTTPAGAAPSLALTASASISPQSQWDGTPGTVSAGTITASSFAAAGLSSIDGFYNGAILTFTGGALNGQSSTVSNYDAASGSITVSPPYSQSPASGDTFTVAPKNGLMPFAQEFENAFPELRAATGLGTAGPKSLFAVRIGDIQPGDNGITVQIDSGSPAYFAPKPLSNTLLSRPDGTKPAVGVIKYKSGGPVADATGTVSANPASSSFSATVSPASGAYSGGMLTFTSGVLNGQSAMITGFSAGTDSAQIYVAPPFTQAPAAGDAFDIAAPVASTFQDVDLDVLARSFLSAIDQFLSAATAVAARQINPADYRRVMMAKEALAEEISLGVTWVLEDNSSVSATALQAAQEAFKQRLLVSLASDYDIDTIVQYLATVTTKGTEEQVPPNLYGQVIEQEINGSVSSATPPTASSFDASAGLSATNGFYAGSTLTFTSGALIGQSSKIITYVGATRAITVDPPYAAAPAANDEFKIVQPDFSLSTAKVALSTEESLLTFLFDTGIDAEASVPLEMQYKVTHIEHDISASSEDGYTSSSWLTLITSDTDPATGEQMSWPAGNVMTVGEANIPVPLRAYPTPPTLTNQNAIAGASEIASGDGSGSLMSQRKWHYECQYQQQYIAQDTVGSIVEFNVPLSSSLAAFAEVQGNDLFYWLARFSVEYPQMAADISGIATAPPATAYYAIQRFADLVWGAAYDLTAAPPAPAPPPDPSSGPWALWVNAGQFAAADLAAGAFEALSQYEYKYHIEQSDPTISAQSIKLICDLSANTGGYSYYSSPIAQSAVSGTNPTAASFTGGADLQSDDDVYDGCVLSFTTGALAGAASAITGYTGASRTIQVAPPFAQAPATGDQFSIGQIPFPDIAVEIVASSVAADPAPQPGTFAGGAELSANDNAYNGYLVTFTTGALTTQSSKIETYTGASREITVETPFTAAPASGDQFEIDVIAQPDTGQDQLTAVYQFNNPNPSNNLTRTLIFDGLDIMGTENAWGGIQLARNLILVEGEETNPLFVYQTPVVRFVNKVTPLIDSSTPVDVAQITSTEVTGANATASSFAGGTELSTVDGFYIGGVATFTSGSLAGESSTITGYTGATQTLEVTPAFSQAPASGDAFIVDIDKIVPPQTKTLVDHLASLFTALFAVTGEDMSNGTRTVRVGCSYEYDIRGDLDPDGSNPIMVSLPVMLVPPFGFDLQTDASPSCGSGGQQTSFVCQMAQNINTWFSYANPSTAQGRFVFDISVFASLTETNLPVLRLREVYLAYQDITLPLFPS
jgi:hypothetical protein